MQSFTQFRILKPKATQRLHAPGILTPTRLWNRHAIDCCHTLEAQDYPASLNLTYASEAVLHGIEWTKLPESIKRQSGMALQKK